jgi:uncharacterized protein YbjT (DUF2867 family)
MTSELSVLIFGATGMVGQAVLRECLLDPGVTSVQTVGRSTTGLTHPKLRDTVNPDLFHLADVEPDLRGFNACFFCLGVSSGSVSQPEYERLTYDLTLSVANTLAPLNPDMVFIYVSGAGTDSSEKGRTAWARVKGRTENALLLLPFKAAYMFRPAVIQPAHGERSSTVAYRLFYTAFKPVLPLLRRAFPRYVLTTEEVGRAMINVAQHGAPKQILESLDIRDCARKD